MSKKILCCFHMKNTLKWFKLSTWYVWQLLYFQIQSKVNFLRASPYSRYPPREQPPAGIYRGYITTGSTDLYPHYRRRIYTQKARSRSHNTNLFPLLRAGPMLRSSKSLRSGCVSGATLVSLLCFDHPLSICVVVVVLWASISTRRSKTNICFIDCHQRARERPVSEGSHDAGLWAHQRGGGWTKPHLFVYRGFLVAVLWSLVSNFSARAFGFGMLGGLLGCGSEGV